MILVTMTAMKDGGVTLGDLAGKITLLEVAWRQCERRGRLSAADRTARRYAAARAALHPRGRLSTRRGSLDR
jgi:hypothetical protein